MNKLKDPNYSDEQCKKKTKTKRIAQTQKKIDYVDNFGDGTLKNQNKR